MISNEITRELVLELKDLGFSMQEYVVLIGELEEKEVKKVNDIKDIKEKLTRLFELLNQKQRLPKEYKDRVEDYKGFRGPRINFDIHI